MKYRFQTRLFQPIIMILIGIIHCTIFTVLLLNILKNFNPFSGVGVLFIVIYVFTIIFYVLAIGYLFQWAEYKNNILQFRCLFYIFKEIKVENIISFEIIDIVEKSPQRTTKEKIIVVQDKILDESKFKYLMSKKTSYGVICYTEKNFKKLNDILG